MSNSSFTVSYASTTCCRPARFWTLFSLRQPACATRRCASARRCAGAERCRPLADRAGHHHVVAEELELVVEPLVQLRQVRVALVVQEVELHPDGRLALARAARAASRTSGSGRGWTGPGSGGAAPASGTAPGRGARSARRSPSTPSCRASCASCPRTSAARAGGTARRSRGRTREAAPAMTPVAEMFTGTISGCGSGPASTASKIALPRRWSPPAR